jgi:lipoprotein-anchoring transpeptidase ErfK/SrfK
MVTKRLAQSRLNIAHACSARHLTNIRPATITDSQVCTGSDARYPDGEQWGRAHTPRGKFVVTRKINGWRLSRLGLLYYPSYNQNGIAIHGSMSMNTYPASHGCIRIPMFAAKDLSEMTPVGMIVVVYD